MIKAGLADVIITGGTEAPIMPIVLAAFDSLKALTRDWNDDPQAASRPFDGMRSGFVLAEGAASLVIEERRHALDRGAPILAEVAGWGETNDCYHMIAPAENGAGLARAMRLAMAQAGLEPEAVDSVGAHATSTPLGDQREAEAIRSVLGNRAEKVSVTAVKSAIGHTLGAAGAVALIGAVMSLQEGLVPPTLNLTNPDEDCALDHVMGEPRRADLRTVMVNAAGFGGHNVSILVASPND
jgi:3-oxoacyl-[acyl-carrier-protein] synthase II